MRAWTRSNVRSGNPDRNDTELADLLSEAPDESAEHEEPDEQSALEEPDESHAPDESAEHEEPDEQSAPDETSVDTNATSNGTGTNSADHGQVFPTAEASPASLKFDRDSNADEVGSDTRSERAPDPPSAAPRRARWPRRAVAAIVILVQVVVVIIAALHANENARPGAGAPAPQSAHPSPSGGSTAGSGPVDLAAARSWITDNLPRSSHVLADRGMSGPLQAAGFRAITASDSADSAVVSSVDWVVSDPASRQVPGLGRFLAASVPVAQFGSGDDSVQIRSVIPAEPGKIQGLLAADSVNRALAGRGLASNPRIAAPAAVHRMIMAGQLDLRVATFLALLAETAPVRVSAFQAVAAETASSRPVRSVSIIVGPAALRTALSTLPKPYRPMSTVTRSGTTTITWSPAVNLIPSIS